MKKSVILSLANIVLQNHHFQMESARASVAAETMERTSFRKEASVIIANTIANLTMLTTLAWSTAEGDKTVYPLLDNAVRDFKLTKIPPELFNEVLRG